MALNRFRSWLELTVSREYLVACNLLTCRILPFKVKRLFLLMKNRSAATRHRTVPSRKRLVFGVEPNPSQGQAYPFTAIVGQEDMKLALILNVIDPLIGGVLIMGHRGTGKSTAVRALADLLPEISAVVGCSYQCDPAERSILCSECRQKRESGEKLARVRRPVRIVDLPLSATEDRICGTIDIERALRDGVRSFEPGLLARANRGFLYIDEVNLLEDHLVDLLLDVAVTGRNQVERENISVEHPARFVLIGSGNPEEGELRPQLQDRFGLHVEVQTENDPDRRVEIVELRQAFESDADRFWTKVAEDQQQLQKQIVRAKKNAAAVRIDHSLLRRIAQLCSELKIDGHRGELTIAKAARALAAFEGRKKVAEDDVRRVAIMSLSHRLKRDPLEETGGSEEIQRALDKFFPKPQRQGRGSLGDGDGGGDWRINSDGNGSVIERPAPRLSTNRQSTNPAGTRGEDSRDELTLPSASNGEPPKFERYARSRVRSGQTDSASTRSSRIPRHSGIRRTRLNYERGRYATAISLRGSSARVAIDATLRAIAGAAYRVRGTGAGAGRQVSGVSTSAGAEGQVSDVSTLPTPEARHLIPALPVPDSRHLTPFLRYKRLARKSGTLFILAIDASGSMALNRISQAKGAAIGLLKQSYIMRDRVAIVGFRGTSAEVLLSPSRSMLRARRALDSLAVGGGTPLSSGLRCSLDLAKRARFEGGEIVLLLFTDGQANVAASGNGNLSRGYRQLLIEREIACLGLELRKQRVSSVVIDTQNEFVANGAGRRLAESLGGTYQILQLKI